MNNVRAKKHLGQHFLNDEQIAFNITNLLSNGTENVVEIGPGMGVLTQFLVKKDFTTEVVEIDAESVFYLRLNYPELDIHEGDFLQLNLQEKYPYNFSLIGNFPYNISSQILFKVFENKDQIPELVGMFQKEVAERVACKKGRKRGILSVFLQAFYDVEYCFTVNEDRFTPPPKVKSGVIKLVRNSRKRFTCDENKFKQIVKAGFNQKRKILRNALKPFTLGNKSELLDLLNLRAEQLSVDDFIKLTKHVR
ncbi:16S rRNA (adenine(1518)-N(6)/adenine(1519)-N(6))-dimethyltransferase RsmA [Flavobacteriales bacterium]|nr:16S rRNA (adenine(1518)-N(6)/adenine(1519)-N(6))-dimethyltransferase RsmA [Flavobacteriales bacterium]